MKVLVLCLPGIGDALMATPMIRVLREECPSATIDVACMFGGGEPKETDKIPKDGAPPKEPPMDLVP